ncbi:Ig-like domain-containing protein [Mycobacterium neumannii]|uniref:Ig-like domain-containing protein n=1 Tax=Mycobacterium neumannii TaxID=2048551 RepID=UPI003AB24021
MALGVGVAVATGGSGLAWADTGPAGDSQTSDTSPGDAPNTSTSEDADADAPSTSINGLGVGTDAGGAPATDAGDSASDGGNPTSGQPTGNAPAMNVRSSGSVNTSVNDAGQATDTGVSVTEAEEDDELLDETATEIEDELEVVDEVELEIVDESKPEIVGQEQEDVRAAVEPESPRTKQDSVLQDTMLDDAYQVSSSIDDVEPAGQKVVDSDTHQLTEPQQSPTSLTSRVMLVVESATDGGDLQTSTTSVVDEPATAQTQALTSAPATFIGIASKFVAALLAPLSAPSPVAPAEPPLAWALVAFVRREWHHMLLNRTPDAVVDTVTTSEGATVTIDVVSGADPDAPAGDVVTVTEVSQPQNGTVSIDGGSLTYAPNPGFHGTDTFTYTISDEQSPLHLHGWRGLWGALFGGDALHTDTVTVTVTVTPVNDAPIAIDDAVAVGEDSGPTVIDVLGNDTDVDDDELTVAAVGAAGNGTVSLVGGVVTYTPEDDFDGTDSFTYTVTDGNGGTATATVTVTVNPVNDAPIAADDHYTTQVNTPLTIAAPGVLANDIDADGDELTALITSMATYGMVVLNGNGSFDYIPNAGFTGDDSFTYRVYDGSGSFATATVTVTVETSLTVITFDDGAAPSEVFTTDDPTRILVRTGSQLRVVDATTGEWLDTIELGATPWSMTMSPDGRFAYVGTLSFSTDPEPIKQIDVETGAVTLIGGVRQPTAMALSGDGGTLYVTNNQDGTVSVIDTETGEYTLINTGLQSSAIAVSEDGTTLYVGSIINDVRVVNLASGTYTVLPTGTNDGTLSDQSITVVGNRVYVTDGVQDKLVVIGTDNNAIIDTYDVGDRPTAVAAMPEDPTIFVANATGSSVTVINTEFGGVIGEIELADSPVDIDVVDGFLYVTTTRGVVVISAEEVGSLIDAPALDA